MRSQLLVYNYYIFHPPLFYFVMCASNVCMYMHECVNVCIWGVAYSILLLFWHFSPYHFSFAYSFHSAVCFTLFIFDSFFSCASIFYMFCLYFSSFSSLCVESCVCICANRKSPFCYFCVCPVHFRCVDRFDAFRPFCIRFTSITVIFEMVLIVLLF